MRIENNCIEFQKSMLLDEKLLLRAITTSGFIVVCCTSATFWKVKLHMTELNYTFCVSTVRSITKVVCLMVRTSGVCTLLICVQVLWHLELLQKVRIMRKTAMFERETTICRLFPVSNDLLSLLSNHLLIYWSTERSTMSMMVSQNNRKKL